MHRSIQSRSAQRLNKCLVCLVVAILVFSVAGTGHSSKASPSKADAADTEIFTASGTLAPGDKHTPGFPAYATKAVNLRLHVPAGAESGSISLTFFDGTQTQTFQGEALDGETLWATLTLNPGYNEFLLENTSGVGGPDLVYELWIYGVDQAPVSWSGESRGDGSWRSHIRLNFPSAGLYEFGFDAASGHYQFLVDGDYVQKTANDAGSVSYYVSAGVHDLYITPDSTSGATTDWSLNVSGPGAANDALPYTKAGGNLGGAANDFGEEWLPINLAVATKANFRLALTGDSSQSLDVYLYGATGTEPIDTILDVYGGETLWWLDDLPAGVSRIRLEADASNAGPLAYALIVQACSAPPASWSGVSLAHGNNSRVLFQVSTGGLYDLAYGVGAGRYQFLVDSDVVIQKTVESAGTVRYYLAAGTHELTILQDHAERATEWSLEIASTGIAHDTLPYHKTGGELGGTGNQFLQEWLPLNVQTGGPANFELTLDGDADDGLVVSLYQGGTSIYTTPVIYGGETFWWPASLTAGANLIKVTAETNAGSLAYDLSVHPVPTPPASWTGFGKGGAGNSAIQLDVESNGTYSVTLDTSTGFARVLIDETALTSDRSIAGLSRVTEFLISLTAGIHRFEIVQDPGYTATDWALGVQPATGGDVIAHLSGGLSVAEKVEPEIPLFGTQNKPVNFRLAVSGGSQLDLAIEDGMGGSAFAGTALSGEVVWGTAVLKPGQNTFTLQNNGAVSLEYDLTVYEIAEVPYGWAGDSAAAGNWDSHVNLNFSGSGVYTFDFGVAAGRYQIIVDDEYIQKTAEADGQVDYYVPAGVHQVTVLPDRTGTDTSWTLEVSATGEANDILPYTRSSRDLWADPARFDTEWIPLNLAETVHANFELTLTGAPADVLAVDIYAGLRSGEIASVANVHGGETVWWSADLPAGVSRIKLSADPSNGGPLAYTMTVHAEPDLPATWSGISAGDGNHSQVRFEVATAGLYDISYGIGGAARDRTSGIIPGRYQFRVDPDATIQKTVESAGTVRYFLDAGVHELTIIQDESAPITEWTLGIAGTAETFDRLPYQQTGGHLGGTDNQFVDEWLPVDLETGRAVNLELTLDGQIGDGLVVSVYQDATEVYSTSVIYGGETYWWPATLATGVNEIKLRAMAGNAGSLAYDLTIHAIPIVAYGAPYAWGGVSRGALIASLVSPSQSEITVQIPVSGTYHVTMDMPNGFATMRIEQPESVIQAGLQAHLEFDVPMSEGSYLFRVVQSADYVTTTWSATVSLKSALDPQIVSIDPANVVNDSAHTLAIHGANFQPGAAVTIEGIAVGSVQWLSSANLEIEIPAGVAAGTYSVTVTNPDGKSDTLSDALHVANPHYLLYLPMVAKSID